jgi:hypothetical protein
MAEKTLPFVSKTNCKYQKKQQIHAYFELQNEIKCHAVI